jgi:hypothetical protein
MYKSYKNTPGNGIKSVRGLDLTVHQGINIPASGTVALMTEEHAISNTHPSSNNKSKK